MGEGYRQESAAGMNLVPAGCCQGGRRAAGGGWRAVGGGCLQRRQSLRRHDVMYYLLHVAQQARGRRGAWN